MATIEYNHIGTASPTTIPMSTLGGEQLIYVIKVSERAGAATVDVDEAGGLGRKLVDLASGTADATIYPTDQITDNTGSGLSQYRPRLIDTPLTVTSTQNCKITIQVLG